MLTFAPLVQTTRLLHKLTATIASLLLFAGCALTVQPNTFNYSVRVVSQDGTTVSGARIVLELTQLAPLADVTDNDGFARILIDSRYVDQPAKLRVEAAGFDAYSKQIDLIDGRLPQEIRLVPSSAVTSSTPVPQQIEQPTTAEAVATLAPSITSISPTEMPEVPTPSQEPPTQTISRNGQFSDTIQSVVYTLTEAKFVKGELQFWFVANNSGADKEICLSFASSLFDEGGTPHQQAYRTNGRTTGIFDCFDVQLPYGVPAKFGVVFSDVAPSAKKIPILKVILGGEGEIQLRDIPLPYEMTATPANASSEPTPAPRAGQFSDTIQDVAYTLTEAKFAKGELQFWFSANNNGADTAICISYASSLIDEAGTPHQQAYRTNGRATGIFDCFDIDLPNGVPVRFGVVFTSVAPSADKIPILEVIVGGQGKLQLRDIPIPYTGAK